MKTELRRGARWIGCASILGAVYAAGLSACNGKAGDERLARSDSNLQSEGEPQSEGAPQSESGGESQTAAAPAALRSGAQCAALLEHFQDQLREQVRQRAEQYRHANQPNYGYPVLLDSAPATPAPASAGADSAVAALAPSSVPSGGFSDTTVQVQGVDEADIVKADADRIYLLQGPTLFVLDAASANSTEILGKLAIEGEAVDLFVRDGKVVVFSRFSGPLPGTDQSTYPYYYYYYPTYTKLTVVDAASGVPQVERESYVEGNYISSRRHAAAVRALVQQTSKAQLDYPNVSYQDFLGHPYSQEEIDLQIDLWAALASDTIDDSVIEDYLPSEYERVEGALVKQPLRCADYWLPGPGLTQSGATSVVTLDLDQVDDPLRHTVVLGSADHVYANDAAVLITQTDYRYYTGEQTSLQTNIHRFDLDGLETRYTASGSFSGYVQSQFSLDELDGVVRLSTTDANWISVVPLAADAGGVGGAGQVQPTPAPSSRILTLGTRGQKLVELGRTRDFGANEQVYATRFLGDRGYVVTFRQIDPLFVVDLADPTAPEVKGELQLQGYSNFLYPLPGHYLLAIGQDANEQGLVQGLALQIFDVRDASAPSLAHKYTFMDDGSSDATYEHRAITFHPDRSLIAFPFQNYTAGQSTLEVFHVSTSDGFTRLGSVHPPSRDLSLTDCLPLIGYPTDQYFLDEIAANPADYSYVFDQCKYFSQPNVRRGLFRGDDVYAVSSLNVTDYPLDHLDGPPLSQVDLPPAYSYYYYPYYGGVGGSAGAAGSTGMAGSAGSASSADAGAGAGSPGIDSIGEGGAAGSAMLGAGGAPPE